MHHLKRYTECSVKSSRGIHSSSVRQALKLSELPSYKHASQSRLLRKPEKDSGTAGGKDVYMRRIENQSQKRNELGVQLLPRKIHSQVFKGVNFPRPDRAFVNIAKSHLQSHDLDPVLGSVLPDVSLDLPPLQGNTIDEHFHRLGYDAAQPWLNIAKQFAGAQPPTKPDYWHIHSGWTKYYSEENGSAYYEVVDAPDEEMLSFDVETMPKYHPYAVMACAVSGSHWYSWISPWLLGESDDPQHLIPLGNPKRHRLVVGHNISYDRARILEEYHVDSTNTRFIDTMSLHVAVKGISSHQRPAWMKYRKTKKEEEAQKEEVDSAAKYLLQEEQAKLSENSDATKRAELKKMQEDIEKGLLQYGDDDGNDAEESSKRWEDITSANSLADVAKLHCGIEMDKEIRNDFLTHTRAQIFDGLQDYMDYCSSDVATTHQVYSKVFGDFLVSCPSPVTFAGVLTMGSSFLTVNERWQEYLENAEGTYRELETSIRKRLVDLADNAKTLSDGEKWRDDVWLNQLDWTPKKAGKTRGVIVSSGKKAYASHISEGDSIPEWFKMLSEDGPFHNLTKTRILPLIFRISIDGDPLYYNSSDGWTYMDKDGNVRTPRENGARVQTLLGKTIALKALKSGRMTCSNPEIVEAIAAGSEDDQLGDRIMQIARDILNEENGARDDPWLSQLNWKRSERPASKMHTAAEPVFWPKWYWDLAKPKKDQPPGALDLTIRSRIAPLLLKLSWAGWPLFHSREHGWIFRVASGGNYETRAKKLSFYDPADAHLQEALLRDGYSFYKLPHKDGETANVGNPFGKTFIKYAQDGTLTSPGNEAKDALDMNAQCSYWISSRDRIMNQMVVWENDSIQLGAKSGTGNDSSSSKFGIIIPQVISMGAVTRRAIERTWLTASNAKANRVGSELKAMVQAPAGYVIVGADVDSEELWISSAMGDAQFGLHGATALGWMTLEGTKAAGTDLHSKTANILGISRDQAKVFNYSRIYGAGMKHAVLLLLQSNPTMSQEIAQKQAEKLYTTTKGKNTHRQDIFGRKFWFGGSESFVFNKLEEIATSDKPLTPALGCGITYALSKEYLTEGFGSDYMTSRINWVVQSSGVDYLHLLIVSMDYLIRRYKINARYLISVHDELRYLVAEQDRYRAALALQIANLWTRCLFAYRLGMDDLPAGVAFFSAVDIDHVLRKEVDLPCVTPSQRTPIPPGESLDITGVLSKTGGGSLLADGREMSSEASEDSQDWVGTLEGYTIPDCLTHRAKSPHFLRAQATTEFNEVKRLYRLESGQKITGGIGTMSSRRGKPRGVTLATPTKTDFETMI